MFRLPPAPRFCIPQKAIFEPSGDHDGASIAVSNVKILFARKSSAEEATHNSRRHSVSASAPCSPAKEESTPLQGGMPEGNAPVWLHAAGLWLPASHRGIMNSPFVSPNLSGVGGQFGLKQLAQMHPGPLTDAQREVA